MRPKRSKKSSKKHASPSGPGASISLPTPPEPIEEPPAPAAPAPVPIAFASVVAPEAEPVLEVPVPVGAQGNELRWCLGVAVAAVLIFAVMAVGHNKTGSAAAAPENKPVSQSASSSVSKEPNAVKK